MVHAPIWDGSIRQKAFATFIDLGQFIGNPDIACVELVLVRDVEMERIRKSKLCEIMSSGVDGKKGGCGV